MKKTAFLLLFAIILIGCPQNKIQYITIWTEPKNINPGNEITIYSDYDIYTDEINLNYFGYDFQPYWYDPEIQTCYSAMFGLSANSYYNGEFTYNHRPENLSMNNMSDPERNQYLLSASGLIFSNKTSATCATFKTKNNITSGYIYINKSIYDQSTFNNHSEYYYTYKQLNVSYNSCLTLSKKTAKIGEKITVTSTNPFFDKDTFSKEKVQNLLSRGYFIVWVEGPGLPYHDEECNYFHNYNYEKIPALEYDLSDVSYNKITFTVPKNAHTGRIHVINEHGINDYSNDGMIVGNHFDENGYFATTDELKIN